MTVVQPPFPIRCGASHGLLGSAYGDGAVVSPLALESRSDCEPPMLQSTLSLYWVLTDERLCHFSAEASRESHADQLGVLQALVPDLPLRMCISGPHILTS